MTAPNPATAQASRAAARSVSAIAANQVAQVAGSLLFVTLVPRTLGPVVYGQLAVAFALLTIAQMCGELGYQEIFSRFLPDVRHSQGLAGVRSMARRLLALRLAVGVVLGVLAALASTLLGDWLTPIQSGLIGASVVFRIWAMGPFALLLGLGETFKWSVETTWRQILVTGLTLLMVREPSLTLGLAALAVHEALFLVLGVWWVRGWLTGAPPPADPPAAPAAPRAPTWRGYSLAHLLRFGFTFSLANLALVVMFRISPIVVEVLTGSHPEAGYFDLALGGLLLIYTLLGQVAYSFVPILTQLHLDSQPHEAEVWLGRMVRYSTMLVALAVGGMWAVAGPASPLLFGADFSAASGSIRMMAFGLLPLPVAWAAVILTAVNRRPRQKLWAALVGLAAFLAAAVVLRAGASPGIALAFAVALLGYTLGFGRDALRAIRAGGAGWALALAATLVFVPLFFIRYDSIFAALGAWSISALVYLVVVVATRAARLDELRPLAQTIRRRIPKRL